MSSKTWEIRGWICVAANVWKIFCNDIHLLLPCSAGIGNGCQKKHRNWIDFDVGLQLQLMTELQQHSKNRAQWLPSLKNDWKSILTQYRQTIRDQLLDSQSLIADDKKLKLGFLYSSVFSKKWWMKKSNYLQKIIWITFLVIWTVTPPYTTPCYWISADLRDWWDKHFFPDTPSQAQTKPSACQSPSFKPLTVTMVSSLIVSRIEPP